jgi:hypothetical protein
LLGELPDQGDVLLQLRVVVVADDERDHGLRGGAAKPRWMDVALAPLGRLG